MAIMLKSARREFGKEQPFIPLGPFKVRFPLIHYGIETPELIQALFLFIVGLGSLEMYETLFNLPFEVALTMVLFYELMSASPQYLGDPIIEGWLTPAIPLVIAFLTTFAMGTERIHALIALQLSLGLIFLIFGMTGLAQKIIKITPRAIKGGILIGAGIAAILGKYGFLAVDKGGVGFAKYPISMTCGALVVFFLLYARGFNTLKTHGSNMFKMIAKIGMVPGVIVAFIVGIIFNEVDVPHITGWGVFNPFPHVGEVLRTFTIFGLGFPPLEIFVKVLPMAIVAYLIGFGDVICGQAILQNAQDSRDDEFIEVSPNRINNICAFRNLMMAFFAPAPPLAGPLWTAMTVVVCERYKQGRKFMDSLFGGAGTFNNTKFICCLFIPLIALVKPILPLGLALTILIQGFACFYIAMEFLENNLERGIAGIMGALLAVSGPTYGLIAGIILYTLLEIDLFGKKKTEADKFIKPACEQIDV